MPILHQCPLCELYDKDIERRRRNTQYINNELNYITSCLKCYQEDEKYIMDMWREYYGNIL